MSRRHERTRSTNPAARAPDDSTPRKLRRAHVRLVRQLFGKVLSPDRAGFDKVWTDAGLDSDPSRRKAVATLSVAIAFVELRRRSRKLRSAAGLRHETLTPITDPGFAFVDLVDPSIVQRLVGIVEGQESPWTETDFDRIMTTTFVVLGATTLDRTSWIAGSWPQRYHGLTRGFRLHRIGYVPPSDLLAATHPDPQP